MSKLGLPLGPKTNYEMSQAIKYKPLKFDNSK